MPVTVEASGGETKFVQEVAGEGETKVDEVIGTFIRRRQSCDIFFRIWGCHIILRGEAVLGFKVSEFGIFVIITGYRNKS